MKVLVLAPAAYDTSPSQRFRIEQWARHLEPLGYEFSFFPFEDPDLHRVLYQPGRYGIKAALMMRAFLRRFGVVTGARKFDVVLVAREASLIGPAVIERLITWLGVPLIYDFDDPLWISYRSPQNKLFSRLKCPSKTKALCRMASQVITGNRLLADWAGTFNPNTHVVPSTIDFAQYSRPERVHHEGPVTLGWTGSHSTLPFLERLHPVLDRLAERESFRLMVISHTDRYSIENASYPVVARRWVADREASDLLEFDIGLAPFPNMGWTPWRCHGKVLQYMASALPVVTSPIGILPDMIDHGDNGFLTDSDDQWIDTLSRLIRDPQLRWRIGQRGRDSVERDFAVGIWIHEVQAILESAVGERFKAPHRQNTQPEVIQAEVHTS
ncbi:MAG: glycosyltransferase family 4 protein [Planctomycetaceae bacterium]